MRVSFHFVFRGALLLCAAYGPAASGADEPEQLLRTALETVCGAPAASLADMADRFPGSVLIAEEPLESGGSQIGWTRRLVIPGGELRIERLAPDGQTRQVTVEYRAVSSDGVDRPLLALVADGECGIRHGRRLLYDDPDATTATAIEHLDEALQPTGQREPLNPPVPGGEDPGGVMVAMVDAGVNYLLPAVHRRLARDSNGSIIGYDYWDLDPRPFDANPSRSPFFVQRHGTRTATLLLREAPDIRLVPYRYPRPDMGRMTDLVNDAVGDGVRLFNMSLGSDDREDWDAFAAAAARHPQALFIVSAGNNGRDIDTLPVFPAALELENIITVTSAENSGEPAPGSNWGRQSVDLLVPAERLVTTGFDGEEVMVSGSSYAAVRITALAARLLAAHPEWGAPELKQAIFERTLPELRTTPAPVRRGLIPRPDKAEDLPLLSNDGPVREFGRYVFKTGDLYEGMDVSPPEDLSLALSMAYFGDTDWRADALRAYAGEAAAILAQCGIAIVEVDARRLDGPAVFHYFHDAIGTELVRRLGLPRPAIFFVADTLQVIPFDAESIGLGNSGSRPMLRDTIWIAEGIADPGIALAHELAHLLMNDGRHVNIADNLMRAETAPSHTGLTADQCEAMVRNGLQNGLLKEKEGG